MENTPTDRKLVRRHRHIIIKNPPKTWQRFVEYADFRNEHLVLCGFVEMYDERGEIYLTSTVY